MFSSFEVMQNEVENIGLDLFKFKDGALKAKQEKSPAEAILGCEFISLKEAAKLSDGFSQVSALLIAAEHDLI